MKTTICTQQLAKELYSIILSTSSDVRRSNMCLFYKVLFGETFFNEAAKLATEKLKEKNGELVQTLLGSISDGNLFATCYIPQELLGEEKEFTSNQTFTTEELAEKMIALDNVSECFCYDRYGWHHLDPENFLNLFDYELFREAKELRNKK